MAGGQCAAHEGQGKAYLIDRSGFETIIVSVILMTLTSRDLAAQGPWQVPDLYY